MNRTAINVLAELIEESFSGIRKQDVKCIKSMDPEEMARVVAFWLRNALEFFTPMANIAMKIGSHVAIGCGPHDHLTEKQLAKKEFRMGFHFLDLLGETRDY